MGDIRDDTWYTHDITGTHCLWEVTAGGELFTSCDYPPVLAVPPGWGEVSKGREHDEDGVTFQGCSWEEGAVLHEVGEGVAVAERKLYSSQDSICVSRVAASCWHVLYICHK